MRKPCIPLLLSLLIAPLLGWGQTFSDSERLQGYLHRNDTSYFLFDADLYGIREASRVVLTGSFREWSQDMDDPQWHIKGGVLALPNPDFANIPPRSEFKFRINDGAWLEPPAPAPNKKGGNLLFMHNMTVPNLKAEILSSGNIWLQLEGVPRPLSSHSFRLTDASDQEVPIAEVLPNTDTESLLIPAKPIDIKRVYFVEIPAYGLKTWCSYDGWFRHLYSNKELGANVNEKGKQTSFRIFAPRAERVMLHLYDQMRGGTPSGSIEMFQDDDGVWEIQVDGDLKGTWYDFTVHGAGDPGNHFFEQNPVHISDPYARVNDDAWGRSMVWERTQPASPLKNGIPPLQNVIAYEVHVQDFTDRLPVADDLKGSFPAFIKPGLKNKLGKPIGFDHLLELGINVVHLMPVQEYMHYRDEVWRESFEKAPFMIKHGINKENYQWGYRTSHAFAVENRYRSKGAEPGEERNQFRDLVQAFHDQDIAVIIDIVPNHSAENMDNEPHFFHWNVLDKIYHYRTRHLDHIGEYGNEVKTENRPMNQRWLIDQCKHFIEEFGVDGFRVDLAGQIDRQTLAKLRQAVGDDIIIYGEPWIASEDPDYESNPSWDWYKHNSPICFFQDDARNAIKGPVSNPVEKERDRGYAGANFREFEKVKLAISSRFPDDYTPLSGINYLDIHDNWALSDQFATHNWDGRLGVDEGRVKLAALLLYTSLGPIVLNGGTEILRSKGHAELKETIKEMTDGTKIYFHGKRDTYNMRIPNQFVWENVGKTLESEDSYCDYDNMLAYWQGLNRFRMSEYGEVFRHAERTPDDYYQWIDTPNPYQLGYLVDSTVLVLINTGSNTHDFKDVYFPHGTWRLIGDIDRFDHVEGVDGPDEVYRELEGGHHYTLWLKGVSALVWVRM